MGFNLTDPSSWGQAVSDAVNSLEKAGEVIGQAALDIGEVLGIVGTQVELTFWLQALNGQFDAGKLWSALGRDYSNFINAEKGAEALEDGDYTKAWNVTTDNGAKVTALISQLGNLAPQPKPQSSYNATAAYNSAMAGKADQRQTAQDLFDHGYYTQGQKLLAAWRTGLSSTPTGTLFASVRAAATGNPVLMLHQANVLDNDAKDPTVIANWKTHAWGVPSVTLGPIAAGLRSKANIASLVKHATAVKVLHVLTPPAPSRVTAPPVAPVVAKAPPIAPVTPAARAAPVAAGLLARIEADLKSALNRLTSWM